MTLSSFCAQGRSLYRLSMFSLQCIHSLLSYWAQGSGSLSIPWKMAAIMSNNTAVNMIKLIVLSIGISLGIGYRCYRQVSLSRLRGLVAMGWVVIR